MRRSTTPLHKFTVPVDPSRFEKILLTYAQNKKIIFEKRKPDLTIDGNVISYRLTPEESNMFDDRKKCQVQMKVETYTGKVYASQIFECNVEEVLDDGDLE